MTVPRIGGIQLVARERREADSRASPAIISDQPGPGRSSEAQPEPVAEHRRVTLVPGVPSWPAVTLVPA